MFIQKYLDILKWISIIIYLSHSLEWSILNFVSFSKKDKGAHLYTTSDNHVVYVQNHVSCEIYNIYKKCDAFNKEESHQKVTHAIAFWKSELENKYSKSRKKKNLRKGYANNLLRTAFILKDKDAFEYALNYIENNKFGIGNSCEYYQDLQTQFLQ